MATIKVTNVIAAPVDRVFQRFTDIEHSPENVSDIKQVEMLTPGAVRRGTRWRETRDVMGVKDSAEMEITSFERNRMYTITHHKAGVQMETSFWFEPVGDGTKVIIEFELEPGGVDRVDCLDVLTASDDALEVLAWLEAQAWCTGSVGMIGFSWGGFNGLQVAARRPPQLKAVEMFYGGVKNSKVEVIFAGQVLGNPLTPQRSNQNINVTDTVRIWAFQNANYDWHTFDLDRDMPIIDSKIGFVDATDPDLKKFKAHGGKLLLYAGWGDTTITPKNTVHIEPTRFRHHFSG